MKSSPTIFSPSPTILAVVGGRPHFWKFLESTLSAALNRDLTSVTSVNNTSQTVPQLCVSQQSTSQPPRLVSRSGQLQEQGFSVEVAERIAAPQRSSTRTIYKSKWVLFEKWCRESLVDFSTPSVKQVSDFFMYLYQDLNRCPSTIDGYRMAIVDRAPCEPMKDTDLKHLTLASFGLWQTPQ